MDTPISVAEFLTRLAKGIALTSLTVVLTPTSIWPVTVTASLKAFVSTTPSAMRRTTLPWVSTTQSADLAAGVHRIDTGGSGPGLAEQSAGLTAGAHGPGSVKQVWA